MPPGARPRIARVYQRLDPASSRSSSSPSALVILVTTFGHGGGPLSVGILLGVAFIAVGAARLWLSGLPRVAGERGSDG